MYFLGVNGSVGPGQGAVQGTTGWNGRRFGKRALHEAAGCRRALVRQDQIRRWFESSAGPTGFCHALEWRYQVACGNWDRALFCFITRSSQPRNRATD